MNHRVQVQTCVSCSRMKVSSLAPITIKNETPAAYIRNNSAAIKVGDGSAFRGHLNKESRRHNLSTTPQSHLFICLTISILSILSSFCAVNTKASPSRTFSHPLGQSFPINLWFYQFPG